MSKFNWGGRGLSKGQGYVYSIIQNRLRYRLLRLHLLADERVNMLSRSKFGTQTSYQDLSSRPKEEKIKYPLSNCRPLHYGRGDVACGWRLLPTNSHLLLAFTIIFCVLFNVPGLLGASALAQPQHRAVPEVNFGNQMPVGWEAGTQRQTERILRGEVRSAADGQAIEGASVTVDKKHTRTDKEGRFTISVDKPTGVLTIKYIGYKEQSVAYKNTSTTLKIALQMGEKQIEEVEVVSTGYQKLNRNNTPGSIVKIDSSLLNLNVSGSLTEKLQFLSPSFLISNTVEGGKRLQIRGMYALREDVAKPLIILDNFPYEGNLDDINPNEIASINILRDASAAAIWGARAGNGVIVLNSIRNKGSGLKINLQSSLTIEGRPDLIGNDQILSTSDFLKFERYKFSLGYGLSDTSDYRRPALSPLYELLLGLQKGRVSGEEVDRQIMDWSSTDLRREYLDYVYRRALVRRYTIDIRQGTERSNTVVSLGFDDNKKNIIGNDNRRLSVMFNNTLKPYRFLEFELGGRFISQRNGLNGLGQYGQMNVNGRKLSPYLRFYDLMGEAQAWDIYYRKEFTDQTINGNLLDWKYYPLDDLRYMDRTAQQHNVMGSFNIRFILNEGNSIRLMYKGEGSLNGYDYVYDKRSYYSRNLINTFTKLENGAPIYQVPNEGLLDWSKGNTFGHSFRAQYDFGMKKGNHTIDGIFGGELSLAKDKYMKGRVYGYNDKLNNASVSYNVLLSTYQNIGGYQYIPYLDGLGETNDRSVSLFTNWHYGFKARYILSFSARRDASNLFGVNTNQKWQPLWSVGGLWKVHDEPFFRLPFSVFELRATYGKSGNINKSVSALPTIRYNPASSQLTLLPSATVMGGFNPELKWEEVNTYNVGLNLASTNRRWRGNIEYYIKNARDVLANEPVDNTTGYTSNPKNSAHIDGSGLDITLDLDLIRRSSLTWRLQWNHSIAHYKVSKYFGAQQANYAGYIGDGSSIAVLEGLNPYTIVSYRWFGLSEQDGSPLGYLDGVTSRDYAKLLNLPFSEQSIGGSSIPLNFGNLLNRISYREFDVSFNISYRMGHYFRKNTISYEKAFLNNDVHSDYQRRWQSSGDELNTNVPSLVYPLNSQRDQFYLNSEATVLKGASIRLNDIQLAYKVSKGKLYNNLKLPIHLFFNLNQINWILWRANEEGIDPDFKEGLLNPMQWSAGFKISI